MTVGFGLGIGTVALLTLLLYYLPGDGVYPRSLSFSPLLIAVNVLFIALMLWGLRLSGPILAFDSPAASWIPCCLIALLAAVLRVVHLGYSEFQGDEATIMLRASSALLGDGSQLFYHQKGPMEVLLPMATWTLSGVINEWQARLPFAFAGVIGVVAVYLLGRRWFDERGGIAAALLLSINGYFVGFGRIVQYQSLVLAMTGLGLLALWRWSEGEQAHWLAVGAALLALGLLAHYDAALVLPAALYLVIRRLRSAPQIRPLVVAVALGFAVLAPFYIPFVLHPNFGKTLGYLSGARMGTGRLLHNNLFSSLPLATFYNSTYYLGALACAAVLASFFPFRRLGLLVPAGTFLLLSVLPGNWAGPLLAGLLVVLLFVSDSAAARTAWLWFGVPFLFYFFLVWDPRTHVLNAFPGAVLLAAFVVDRLLDLVPRPFRRLLTGVLLVACLFLACYPYLMFVRHDPEIKRTWPDHRPVLYWRPNLEVPRYGYFGFPYRAGWKVVGALVQKGLIDGVYASNEEQAVTDWYTRGAERTYCDDPEWCLVAQHVQDEVPIPMEDIEENHDLWGTVQVAGRPKLNIYRREPAPAAPTTYDAEAFASGFDAYSSPAMVLSARPSNYTPTDYALGQSIRLVGYRVDGSHSHPGGSVRLVLYWKALRPLVDNYQVFTHLYDGALWGQHDGAPACAMQPTTLWEPGRIVRDEHVIPIDPVAPTGDIPLLVGMYSLHSGERLPVGRPGGELTQDVIPLTTVRVSQEPSSLLITDPGDGRD